MEKELVIENKTGGVINIIYSPPMGGMMPPAPPKLREATAEGEQIIYMSASDKYSSPLEATIRVDKWGDSRYKLSFNLINKAVGVAVNQKRLVFNSKEKALMLMANLYDLMNIYKRKAEKDHTHSSILVQQIHNDIMNLDKYADLTQPESEDLNKHYINLERQEALETGIPPGLLTYQPDHWPWHNGVVREALRDRLSRQASSNKTFSLKDSVKFICAFMGDNTGDSEKTRVIKRATLSQARPLLSNFNKKTEDWMSLWAEANPDRMRKIMEGIQAVALQRVADLKSPEDIDVRNYDLFVFDADSTLWDSTVPGGATNPPYDFGDSEDEVSDSDGNIVSLRPGIRELLDKLSSMGKSVGLISKSEKEGVPFEDQPVLHILKKLDVLKYFNEMIVIDRSLPKSIFMPADLNQKHILFVDDQIDNLMDVCRHTDVDVVDAEELDIKSSVVKKKITAQDDSPNTLYHTTSLYSLSDILKSREIKPGSDGFVSLSERPLFGGDISHSQVSIAFGPRIAQQFMKVDYSPDWAEQFPEHSSYIAGEGWREQFESPVEMDEDGFYDQDEEDAAWRDAEMESFLHKDGEEEWVSVEPYETVGFSPGDITGIIVEDQGYVPTVNDFLKEAGLSNVKVTAKSSLWYRVAEKSGWWSLTRKEQEEINKEKQKNFYNFDMSEAWDSFAGRHVDSTDLGKLVTQRGESVREFFYELRKNPYETKNFHFNFGADQYGGWYKFALEALNQREAKKRNYIPSKERPEKPKDGKEYQLDHKKPRWKGGSDKKDNLQWVEKDKHKNKSSGEGSFEHGGKDRQKKLKNKGDYSKYQSDTAKKKIEKEKKEHGEKGFSELQRQRVKKRWDKHKKKSKVESWYKKAYSPENAYLRDYLKEGFDPYDYQHLIKDFIEERGDWEQYEADYEDFENREYYDIFDEWVERASEEEKKTFRDFVQNRAVGGDYDAPAYEHLDYQEYLPATWLVHFTDDAQSIKESGFSFGHWDMQSGLGLTTWKTDRKKEPGYNFAFELGSKDSISASRENKYGEEAVVFWSDGVSTHHHGDQENQIVFWGEKVNKNMIFPITREYDEWVVSNAYGRDVYKNENFEEAANWITNNYQMLQHAEEKLERIKKEEERQRAASTSPWYRRSQADFENSKKINTKHDQDSVDYYPNNTESVDYEDQSITPVNEELEPKEPHQPVRLQEEKAEESIDEEIEDVLKSKSSDLTNTPQFKEWFGESKVLDRNGKPLVVYHGTTHEFESFEDKNQNLDNYLGGGFYFTDSAKDASENYAGQGPDLTARIEDLSDSLHRGIYYGDIDVEDYGYSYDEDNNVYFDENGEEIDDEVVAREIAIREIAGPHEGAVTPVYLKVENPLDISPVNPTFLDFEYEVEQDPHDEDMTVIRGSSGKGAEFLDNLKERLYELTSFHEDEIEDLISEYEQVMGELGGMSASQLISNLKREPFMLDLTDDDGNIIKDDVISDIIFETGYDGIVMDAHTAFPSMEHITEKTKHYMLRNPSQIKSIFNEGTFSSEDKRIRYQKDSLLTASKKRQFEVREDIDGNDEKIYIVRDDRDWEYGFCKERSDAEALMSKMKEEVK